MDRFPWMYSIMARELEEEGKIRPFGEIRGESISDPRNYLYIELEATNKQSGLVVWVKVKDQPRLFSSNRGRMDLVISRSGWYRTTVELPPGTRPDQVEFVALECMDLRDPILLYLDEGTLSPAESVLRNISKIFFLDAEYKPGKNLLETHRALTFHPGDMVAFSPSEY